MMRLRAGKDGAALPILVSERPTRDAGGRDRYSPFPISAGMGIPS
jgi:hypothetical protein